MSSHRNTTYKRTDHVDEEKRKEITRNLKRKQLDEYFSIYFYLNLYRFISSAYRVYVDVEHRGGKNEEGTRLHQTPSKSPRCFSYQ